MKIKRFRVSVVILHENKILGFRGKDPHTGVVQVFLPGGAVEAGETLESAALREVLEETGYEVSLEANLRVRRVYDYEWNGQIYDCDTTYFRATSPQLKTNIIDDAAYHLGIQWVPLEDVMTVFGYHKDICEPVLELLKC